MASYQKNTIKSRIEEVLSQKDKHVFDSYSKSLEELVEELKIYQYELEFQNEELLRIQDELELSRNAYRNLFQNAPVGYVVLNEESKILDLNEAFMSLGGGMVNLNPGMDFRKIIDPDSQDVFHYFWNELIGSCHSKTVEIKLSGSAVEPVIVQINGLYQKDSHQIMVSVVDITGKKKTERQLEKLIAEKDKFFFIIAHDLRNPMNAFLGLTEMLSGDLQSFSMDEIQETANTMKRSAVNLNRLIENLLHWARIQQGTITFSPEWQLIRPVIDEIVQLLTDSLKCKEIRFSLNVPTTLAIYADRQMLAFVIRNTLINAIKFTNHQGSIHLSVENINEEEVLIKVKDSGIGMNEKLLGQLFKINELPGRKGTDGEPGTGLGLILCKEVIEKHGGRIWVESQPEIGSTFYMTFTNKPVLSAKLR